MCTLIIKQMIKTQSVGNSICKHLARVLGSAIDIYVTYPYLCINFYFLYVPCTGSLYCDKVLRARGFTGEFLRGPSVIAIKSHGIKGLFTHGQLPRRIFNNSPIYGAAILLVRDPKSALVAEWHRERTKRQTNATSSNHYLLAGEEYFSK